MGLSLWDWMKVRGERRQMGEGGDNTRSRSQKLRFQKKGRPNQIQRPPRYRVQGEQRETDRRGERERLRGREKKRERERERQKERSGERERETRHHTPFRTCV